jgi:YVTN family beta-propeller protein
LCTHQGASAGQLVVIELTEEAPEIRSIEIGGHPAHVVPDGDGRFAFVTDAETNSVVVADLRELRAAGRIPVGSYPHGLRLSPDGRTLAVANMRSGTVSLVDAAERKRIADVEVGRRPVQVGFDPSGRYLVVSLNGENKVGVIDVAARKLLWKAEVGRGPVQVFVTPDGNSVLVANPGGRNEPRRPRVGGVVRHKENGGHDQSRKGSSRRRTGPGRQDGLRDEHLRGHGLGDRPWNAVTWSYPTGKGPNGVAVR